MADQRRAGLITLQVDGEVYDAKGSFSSNLGAPLREAIVGSDRVHGYREMPQVAFIEGEITDKNTLSIPSLATLSGVTVTLTFGNGKVHVLHDAWFAGEGTVTSEEGAIAVRFEGTGDEVLP